MGLKKKDIFNIYVKRIYVVVRHRDDDHSLCYLIDHFSPQQKRLENKCKLRCVVVREFAATNPKLDSQRSTLFWGGGAIEQTEQS